MGDMINEFNPSKDFAPSQKYANKYEMTREANIMLAKRNVVDSIWKSARLEGVNVTFPQTYAIYEKAKVSGVSVDDILTVINLKHGWEYILSEIGKETTLDTLCRIQAEVAKDQALTTGVLRTGRVGIGGTEYVPKIPEKEEVEKELEFILSNEAPVDRALNLMFWGMKSQLFFDGNKRTSMLAANKIMIENGCGIISISENNLEEFQNRLSEYYSYGRIEEAKDFVYENCIDGIIFEKEAAYPQIEEREEEQEYEF